jgi:Spy/CpxP family protein refolding chaperone
MRRSMSQQAATDQPGGGGGGRGGGSGGMGDESHFRHSGSAREGASRGGALRQTGGVGHLLRNAEDHNLTEEQEERLEKMQVEFELEKVDLQAALSRAKILFRALARDHNADEQEVMKAIDKLARAEANLRKMRYRHLKAAREVLNEEQRKGLKGFHKQRVREKVRALRLARQGGGISSG